jgi:hypothetical protein
VSIYNRGSGLIDDATRNAAGLSPGRREPLRWLEMIEGPLPTAGISPRTSEY